MLTLHGFPYSNYHNIVKHALMQKGIAFEENITYPNTPELLAVSPTGKAPAMTTENGIGLSESSVLVDYLEDAYPENPLYPSNAESKAQVRQLMKVSELYIELPARRLLPAALTNTAADPQLVIEVRAVLERGVNSIIALASFSPYVMGAELTLADIYLRYALAIPKMVGPSLLDWDVFAEISGLTQWDELMAATDIAKKIDSDQADNAKEFMDMIAKNSKK